MTIVAVTAPGYSMDRDCYDEQRGIYDEPALVTYQQAVDGELGGGTDVDHSYADVYATFGDDISAQAAANAVKAKIESLIGSGVLARDRFAVIVGIGASREEARAAAR